MIAVYYFITGDLNFSDASQYSNQNKSISPGWWFDAINYASLQIAAAFSFLTVMGGYDINRPQFWWTYRWYYCDFTITFD